MRIKRALVWIGGGLLAVVALVLAYAFLILDWEGRPICHKQVCIALRAWLDQRKTDVFPNDAGDGRKSLAAIFAAFPGLEKTAGHYRFVPGLREDDPGDLVLMYIDRPTRWTWHGPPPTIFEEKAWIVVPVDFVMGSRRPSGPGELSERVTEEEFRARLRRTIDFVRDQRRPHWETVVAEHERFLYGER